MHEKGPYCDWELESQSECRYACSIFIDKSYQNVVFEIKGHCTPTAYSKLILFI